MDRLRQDLIVSVRRLRRSPAFTIVAVLTLALGIGANTIVFTAVNTLLFRPLPVDHPNELAYLNLRAGTQEIPTLSYPDYVDFRDRSDVFAGLILYRIAAVNFGRGDGNGVRVWSYEVSGNYFDVLGIRAWRGRLIQPDDDRNRGAHPVVVLSYACWQRRFGGGPGVVGRTVKINGLDFSVIGVAPAGFFGTEIIYTPEIWVPIAMEAQIEPGNSWLDNRGSRNAFVLGRLKRGVSWRHAEAAINAIADDLGRQYPDAGSGMKIALSTPGLIGNFIRGAVRGFALVLMATAGLVLLIACVNLASLLLARASERRKETALRLALGASRGQIVRELLTESSVLSVAGGGAGLLLAVWLADLFAAWRPPIDIPVFPALIIDSRVTAFAVVVSLLTTILFGLVPA